MVVELVRNILQTFAQYVSDPDSYNTAFMLLSVLIPVIVIGTICLLLLIVIRGIFKND